MQTLCLNMKVRQNKCHITTNNEIPMELFADNLAYLYSKQYIYINIYTVHTDITWFILFKDMETTLLAVEYFRHCLQEVPQG